MFPRLCASIEVFFIFSKTNKRSEGGTARPRRVSIQRGRCFLFFRLLFSKAFGYEKKNNGTRDTANVTRLITENGSRRRGRRRKTKRWGRGGVGVLLSQTHDIVLEFKIQFPRRRRSRDRPVFSGFSFWPPTGIITRAVTTPPPPPPPCVFYLRYSA